MKGRLILGVGLVVLAVAAGLTAWGIVSAQATGEMAPEEVVTRFYDWYLGYIGEGEMRRNPLVDRAYRSSELLSEAFIAEVDEMLDSGGPVVGDPFLLAQDVPVKVEVGEAELSGDEASVKVDLFWGGNPTPSERIVTLKLANGRWKITGLAFEAE